MWWAEQGGGRLGGEEEGGMQPARWEGQGKELGTRKRNLEIVLLDRPGVRLFQFGANNAYLLRGQALL